VTVALGVDLGWQGKPTGLAAGEVRGERLVLTDVARLEGRDEILRWIEERAGRDCVCAVDAPLVIPNATGIRLGERELNARFQRHHAGCHPANLGRPFAAYVTGFSRALQAAGFEHAPGMSARSGGRWQLEAHPHAAAVSFFGLDRIVKYKKGRRADRGRELQRLRDLITGRLPVDNVGLIPQVPEKGALKPAEDQIDAVLCACIAAHWWQHGRQGSDVFGDAASGYVIVPAR
jgi:predicted RNase H-like nuclease